MERELRELYDANGNRTGKTYFKGDLIPQGYHQMVVGILIENDKNEFLMQKRVARKGGYYGITGGHPKAGETPMQGIITEVYEEIGIDISNDNLILFDEGCDGVDCFKFYYLKKDIDISKCILQEDELDELAWFHIDLIKQMIKTNKLEQAQASAYQRYFNYLKNNLSKNDN